MNRDPAFAASFSAGASPARCVVACSGTQAGMTARLLFGRYHGTALIGERLLDDEAERGVRTWTSPTEIARRRHGTKEPTYCSKSHAGAASAISSASRSIHLERAGPVMLMMRRAKMMGQN